VSTAVYIVDDDPALRDSLAAVLIHRGYDISVFPDGNSFLAELSDIGEGCVLLDVRLPDMSGIDVLARVAEAAPQLAVVMVTGHGDVPLAVAAMKAGAVDFVEKPVRADALPPIIEAALGAKEPVDPELRDRLEELTAREREVLELLVLGRANKEIARALGISPRTAEVHRARVMRKMDAESLSHLVRMALGAGIDPRADI